MECPYCAETINDAAHVCPHCRNDMRPFKGLLEELRRVSTELSTLRAATLELRTIAKLSHPDVVGAKRSHANTALLAVLLSSIGSIGSFNLTALLGSGPERSSLLLLISTIFPAVGSLLLAWRRANLAFASILSLAILIGLIDMLGVVFSFTSTPETRDFKQVFTQFVVWQVPMFVFSYYFGEQVFGRFTGQPIFDQASPHLARLAAENSPVDFTAAPPKKDERWKSLLAALAPALTFLGTVLSAYLGYLAKSK